MTEPTTRELLEGAARAAGIEVSYHHGCGDALELVKPRGFQVYWNPLTDDGDALRLMAKTGIVFSPYFANVLRIELHSCAKGEESKAYRRAIVRAVLREEELRSGKS